MKFEKELLQELAYMSKGEEEDGVKVVSNKDDGDNSRWHSNHTLVIEKDGKLYRGFYRLGLTENQDHEVFEYDSDCDLEEVKAVTKTYTKTKYESVTTS